MEYYRHEFNIDLIGCGTEVMKASGWFSKGQQKNSQDSIMRTAESLTEQTLQQPASILALDGRIQQQGLDLSAGSLPMFTGNNWSVVLKACKEKIPNSERA